MSKLQGRVAAARHKQVAMKMFRKSPADRERAGDRIAPPNEVAEEPMDADADGISGGFRRVAPLTQQSSRPRWLSCHRRPNFQPPYSGTSSSYSIVSTSRIKDGA
jgi:hypothetical protein